LEEIRHTSVDGAVLRDRVAVAHLRMGLEALQSLRSALDGIILLATPKPDGQAH
jgi:hypothetical protein